jgi:hypothetical protein
LMGWHTAFTDHRWRVKWLVVELVEERVAAPAVARAVVG